MLEMYQNIFTIRQKYFQGFHSQAESYNILSSAVFTKLAQTVMIRNRAKDKISVLLKYDHVKYVIDSGLNHLHIPVYP